MSDLGRDARTLIRVVGKADGPNDTHRALVRARLFSAAGLAAGTVTAAALVESQTVGAGGSQAAASVGAGGAKAATSVGSAVGSGVTETASTMGSGVASHAVGVVTLAKLQLAKILGIAKTSVFLSSAKGIASVVAFGLVGVGVAVAIVFPSAFREWWDWAPTPTSTPVPALPSAPAAPPLPISALASSVPASPTPSESTPIPSATPAPTRSLSRFTRSATPINAPTTLRAAAPLASTGTGPAQDSVANVENAPFERAPGVSPSLLPSGDSAAARRRSENSSSGTLRAEMQYLQSAQNALRHGNATQALGVLDEHAAKYPTGILKEERLAARVAALCQLGRVPEAIRDAEAFLKMAPQSPLVPQVRQSCVYRPSRK